MPADSVEFHEEAAAEYDVFDWYLKLFEGVYFPQC